MDGIIFSTSRTHEHSAPSRDRWHCSSGIGIRKMVSATSCHLHLSLRLHDFLSPSTRLRWGNLHHSIPEKAEADHGVPCDNPRRHLNHLNEEPCQSQYSSTAPSRGGYIGPTGEADMCLTEVLAFLFAPLRALLSFQHLPFQFH